MSIRAEEAAYDLSGWCRTAKHDCCDGALRHATGWHWYCACPCHPDPPPCHIADDTKAREVLYRVKEQTCH